LKSAVTVRNVLGTYGGILYAQGNLTLKSDSNLTARVDVVPAAANIIGKTIVQRYFPAKRSWRLITSPLTSTPTIFNTWQNKGVFVAGINTCVSGPNPTGAGGNGLDVSLQNNASMKTWNYASQALFPVLNTHVALSPGNAGSADNIGYFLFVRGDRSFSNFSIPNTNITTLNSDGQLQVGTQNFPASNVSAGFTLIGNPFASPVDFNLISRNNVVKRFYVWDPSMNVVGGYVMLDDLDNDGIYIKSVNASKQTNHIQSSQAFFVETISNGSAGISFLETCKSAGNNNLLFRPQHPAQISQTIRIRLNIAAADSSMLLADEVLLECKENYSDSVDTDDALKLSNINENIGLLRYSKVLTAERRPLLQANDTLFLKINRTTQRKYQLEIAPDNISDESLLAFLEDSYLKSSTSIDLKNISVYDFKLDSNAASSNPGRFYIVFKKVKQLPTPTPSGDTCQQITVYPNPVSDNVIHFKLNNYPAGKCLVKLLSQTGQTVYENVIQCGVSTNNYSIRPGICLSAGIYVLQITGQSKKILTKQIVVSQR
jgi:Secretion system C-terminal sorting domain